MAHKSHDRGIFYTAPGCGLAPAYYRSIGLGARNVGSFWPPWLPPNTLGSRTDYKVETKRVKTGTERGKTGTEQARTGTAFSKVIANNLLNPNSGRRFKSRSTAWARPGLFSDLWIEPGLGSTLDFVVKEYERLAEVIEGQEYRCYPPHRTSPWDVKRTNADDLTSILTALDNLSVTKDLDHVTRSDSMVAQKIEICITGDVLGSSLESSRKDTNARLSKDWQTVKNCRETKENVAMGKILEDRDSLPIARMREEILETVSRAGVVVIAGDTGSGKSTQVPQYVRESMVEAGRATDCSVVVTQPRRISAISLAERVAHEMGQSASGNRFESEDRARDQLTESIRPGWWHTGFHVRLFRRLPQRQNEGPILFCTPAILLRKMGRNTDLEGISHVIVDEVHEHDVHTDLLLAVLKRIQLRNSKLKVILMSATIDTEIFSRYFNDCPIINVNGRTFPVETYYLPDIHKLFASMPQILIPTNELNQPKTRTNTLDLPMIDEELTVKTITHIHVYEPPGGAILVFLPGWQEIQRIKDILESYNRGPRIRKKGKVLNPPMHVLVVHSSLSQEAQSKIFERTRDRKVILSTNITETAVTIVDVVYVVDCGLANENKYDPKTGINCLDTIWVSKSNIRQRKGRAGRVQKGKTFHLFTSQFHDTLPDNPVPEILRISLESTVLEVKVFTTPNLDSNIDSFQTSPATGVKAADFLSSLMIPPTQSAIDDAVSKLRDQFGFLDEDENLTHFGRRLIHMACHPRLSLAMAWASFFRCPGPITSLAAIVSYDRSLFLSKWERPCKTTRYENEEDLTPKNIKNKFARGSNSDYIALVHIYDTWHRSCESGTDSNFEEENGIDWRNVRFIDGIRSKLASELVSSHLVERAHVRHSVSSAKFDHKLLRAILGASFYPNIAKVRCGKGIRDRTLESTLKSRQGIIVCSTDSICSGDYYDTDWVAFLNTIKLPHRQNSLCQDLSTFSPMALALFAGRSLERLEIPQENENGDLKSPEARARAKKFKGNPHDRYQQDGRTLLRLDGEFMLTLSTSDTQTADRILKLRHVIFGLFEHFIKVGVTCDSYSDQSVLQLRKGVISLCRKLIESNHM